MGDEEMTRRILHDDEMRRHFTEHGDGLTAEQVAALLAGGGSPKEALLSQIVSGELDVDKMDYLRRDSLYCGVGYGSFDLSRLLETVLPLQHPGSSAWGIGFDDGGVHALEALVMARYYMFTQVYFNVTGKALEHHLTEWLRVAGRYWPDTPERFLEEDDHSVLADMRRSDDVHARAVVHREHFPLAFETREHPSASERAAFEAAVPELEASLGEGSLLVARSAKDPHRLASGRVLVEGEAGAVEPLEEASDFLRHLSRIDVCRVYARPELRDRVAAELRARIRTSA